MHEQPTAHVIGTFQPQLEFARHNLDTQQGTIRHLDSKAGVFITVLVFLATRAVITARDACTRLHWRGEGAVASWFYLGSSFLFVLGFIATAMCVRRVIRPRASPSATLADGLVFARDVLSHANPDNYYQALRIAPEETLLKDLSFQIFNLSTIVKRKTHALRVAWWPTVICFLAWALNAIVVLYLLRRRP